MSTPIEIDQELAKLRDEIDLWDQRLAWFEAKRNWRKTLHSLAEADAAMNYSGPATKAKWHAITKSVDERTALDIAEAELLMCERKMHSLDKATFLLLGRNKNAMNSYMTERNW